MTKSIITEHVRPGASFDSLDKTRKHAESLISYVVDTGILNPRKLVDIFRLSQRKHGEDPSVFAQELRRAAKSSTELSANKEAKMRIQHTIDMFMGLEENVENDSKDKEQLQPEKSKFVWNVLKKRYEPVGVTPSVPKKRGRPTKTATAVKTEANDVINPSREATHAKLVGRIANLALYGQDDSEILVALKDEIDDRIVTPRWVKFIAKAAREGLMENSGGSLSEETKEEPGSTSEPYEEYRSFARAARSVATEIFKTLPELEVKLEKNGMPFKEAQIVVRKAYDVFSGAAQMALLTKSSNKQKDGLKRSKNPVVVIFRDYVLNHENMESQMFYVEESGDGGMGPSFNNPNVYANATKSKSGSSTRMAREHITKLTVEKLSNLVKKLMKEAVSELKTKKKLRTLLKDKQLREEPSSTDNGDNFGGKPHLTYGTVPSAEQLNDALKTHSPWTMKLNDTEYVAFKQTMAQVGLSYKDALAKMQTGQGMHDVLQALVDYSIDDVPGSLASSIVEILGWVWD